MEATISMPIGRSPAKSQNSISPSNPGKQTGLTFLEVILVIALISTMVSFSIPVFRDLAGNNRLVSQINTLSGILAYTRTEAVRRNVQVVMCKSNDGQSCHPHGSWSEGMIVFVDEDNNESREGTEEILYHHKNHAPSLELEYRAFGSRHYFVYRPDGSTKNNGTFTFCEKTSGQGRALIINKVGRVRVSDKTSKGKAIICTHS